MTDKGKTTVTMALTSCPCGKLIGNGATTCKSCAPAYQAGFEAGRRERTLEIEAKISPWVIGFDDVMRLNYPECFEKGESDV